MILALMFKHDREGRLKNVLSRGQPLLDCN